MSTRKIVVGYDRSTDAKAAARWALDEAARTGAPVEFFFAYPWPVWAAAAPMVPATSVWPDSATVQEIQQNLEDAVAHAARSHPGVRVTTGTTDNDPALALIGRSAEAAMIVLGSRGHSAVTNLLGSVSSAVSAHADCPVVVVRGRPDGAAPVVAGVDGSALSEAALAFAAEQAHERGVPLRVIRAWKPTGWRDPDGRPGAGSGVKSPTIAAEQREPFDRLVAQWRQKYPDLQISAEAVVAHPAAALTEASATAQLVVVGSRGRGAVRAVLLGSVSQHLLRHAGCPVAVVHEAR